MTSVAQVAEAQARTRAARARLFATFEELQHRLTATALAEDAVEIASESAVAVARSAAEAVRSRPMVLAGVLGAIGLVAARGPIARALKGKDQKAEAPAKIEHQDATRTPSTSSKPKRVRTKKGS
jgi:ElaB/YqjD/DUF883 family membrane-anchored ribosome-binding protein